MAKPIKDNPETEAPTEPPAEAPKAKAPKSASVRLVGPKGSTDEALILGYQAKDGWTISVTVYDRPYKKGEEREGKRGASQKVANLAEARKAIEKIEKAMVARGWVKPETKPLGLVRKPDSFDLSSLPAPAKPKK